jgi:hypothetical protein
MLILLFTIGCSVQKEIVIEIEYKATTRGSSEVIKFKGNTLSYNTNKALKELVLSDAKLKEIEFVVLKISLDNIVNLKAPTNKRFSDGAMEANISFKKGNKVYTSSNFDHGNPPKELKPIIDLLKKYLY